MKFKIGDYVRFVNERQEGIVTRIIDHQLVGVTIEDDFEISVAAGELVLVSQQETQLLDHEVQIEERAPMQQLAEEGIYLALVRNEIANTVFDLQLINLSDYQLLFSCSGEIQGNYSGIASGSLEGHKKIVLSTYSSDTVNEWPVFHLQCIYHSKGKFQPKQPLIIRQKIKPKSIFGQEQIGPDGQQKGFFYQLDQNEIEIATERLPADLGNKAINAIFIPAKEVDLHIEELTEHFPSMSPSEILNFQLEHFRRCLESAIVHKFDSIIFIHGVGNGTLRYEIQKKLSNHPNVRTYKDARKEKFGYGATEVLLK